jgi:hypothetical protein
LKERVEVRVQRVFLFHRVLTDFGATSDVFDGFIER